MKVTLESLERARGPAVSCSKQRVWRMRREVFDADEREGKKREVSIQKKGVAKGDGAERRR